MIDKLTFRKILIWIKRKTNTDAKNLYIINGSIFIISAILSIIFDMLTPSDGIWMLLRLIFLAPITSTLFILSYSLSYSTHNKMIINNPEWLSFRDRFSPSWRNRISIIIGAVLIVVAYASSPEMTGYTLISSVLLTVVVNLLAFIRKTTTEKEREELGIEDLRDIEYKKVLTEIEKDQEEKNKEKREKKSAKKYKRWGIKDKNYVPPKKQENTPPDPSTNDDKENF